MARSRGTVKLNSSDPFEYPLSTPPSSSALQALRCMQSTRPTSRPTLISPCSSQFRKARVACGPRRRSPDTENPSLSQGTAPCRLMRAMRSGRRTSATYTRYVQGCSLRLKSLTRLAQPVYHPIGTASMLPRADGGAVDTAFKLYGTTNVRVVGEQALLAVILVERVAHLAAQMRPSCRFSSRRTYPRLFTASRRRRQG
jgi:choline dehydrogenase-like flavoprotein